ncbi:hypothetical protein NDU88_006020 [Pleurodeles waltl]|uniref:Uncharacterized protein n=1 Tax=Pleurodeles waltl TaxID=8319 RepID=A0AAV7VKT7_PLEWA|nr:hypothetical protein NDU88_006020 [Pleurodeles waltl]
MPCRSARALVSTWGRIGILGGRATNSRCSGLMCRGSSSFKPQTSYGTAPEILQVEMMAAFIPEELVTGVPGYNSATYHELQQPKSKLQWGPMW